MTAHIMLSMDEWVEHLQQQATIAKQREIISECLDLIAEVVQEHACQFGAEYNECDTDPCRWCRRAAAVRKAEEVLK